jgi:hypothetical protein
MFTSLSVIGPPIILDWFEAPEQFNFPRPPPPVNCLLPAQPSVMRFMYCTLVSSFRKHPTRPSRPRLRHMNPSSLIEKHFMLQPNLYADPASAILFSLLTLIAQIGPRARPPFPLGATRNITRKATVSSGSDHSVHDSAYQCGKLITSPLDIVWSRVVQSQRSPNLSPLASSRWLPPLLVLPVAPPRAQQNTGNRDVKLEIVFFHPTHCQVSEPPRSFRCS